MEQLIIDEEKPLTLQEKVTAVFGAVFGTKIAQTKEPGLIIRVRRIERAIRWLLLGTIFVTLRAAGVPTEDLIKALSSMFVGVAQAAGIHLHR